MSSDLDSSPDTPPSRPGVLEEFRKALARGRLAHAYLLHGPPGIGKRTLALDVARVLLCSRQAPTGCDCFTCRWPRSKLREGKHPDLHCYDVPEGKRDLPVTVVDEFLRALGHRSFLGGRRVFVLASADRMTPSAANRMLKGMEEPPASCHVLLVTDRREGVLTTIRSRAHARYLAPLPPEAFAALVGADPASAAVQAAGGSFPRYAELAEEAALADTAREMLRLLPGTGPGDLTSALQLARVLAAGAGAEEGAAGSLAQRRETVRTHLDLLARLLRDVLLAGSRVPGVAPVQPEQASEVAALAGQLPPARARVLLERVFAAKRAIRQNVDPALAVERLVLAG